VSGDLKCMIHTWFIAADFQLGIYGTALLLIVYKYEYFSMKFGSLMLKYFLYNFKVPEKKKLFTFRISFCIFYCDLSVLLYERA
jgi:hypothetical protein